MLQLLKAISDKSDGGAYYNVTKPTTLNTAISSPLAYIKNIVAKDLEITLTMEQKVSKITVPNFREKPGQNGSGSKTFHIGSVVRDPKKPLLITVEFDLPPAPARPDPQTVMSYKWNYWYVLRYYYTVYACMFICLKTTWLFFFIFSMYI